jgi:hypothetical protein
MYSVAVQYDDTVVILPQPEKFPHGFEDINDALEYRNHAVDSYRALDYDSGAKTIFIVWGSRVWV